MSEFPEVDLYTEIDDELYEELADLIDDRIVHVEVWEESLGDIMEDDGEVPPGQFNFDIDLYLESGVYFELYSTVCYPTIDSEPIEGLATVQERLTSLKTNGITLIEIAVDEDNALILVLGQPNQPQLYLLVSAWTVGEWDELPTE
ncbi:MAG: hypothetical protein KF832_16390 [Caldilineaceae bacterium]|nr:hypothetical protein [Caldilineaceae bacterium]